MAPHLPAALLTFDQHTAAAGAAPSAKCQCQPASHQHGSNAPHLPASRPAAAQVAVTTACTVITAAVTASKAAAPHRYQAEGAVTVLQGWWVGNLSSTIGIRILIIHADTLPAGFDIERYSASQLLDEAPHAVLHCEAGQVLWDLELLVVQQHRLTGWCVSSPWVRYVT